MAQIIGTQTGIISARDALKVAVPGHDAAFNNLATTQTTLVAGHNEYQNRISALEAEIASIPFPASS